MTFSAAPVWIAAAFAAGPLIPSVAATTAPDVDATRDRNDAERKATPGVPGGVKKTRRRRVSG